MKVICDISVTSARNRSREGWHPGYLFRGGAQGAWYDPSDTSTLFQDVAGTIPVATDGDPVALIQDKSGNGNHAAQTTPAARPSWRTDGVLSWLEFDGADDKLVSDPVAFVTGEFGLCIGLEYQPADPKFGAWRAWHVDGVYIGLSHPTNTGAIQSISGQLMLNGVIAPTTRADLRQALLTPGVGTATGISTAAFAGNTWQFAGYSAPATPGCRVFGYLESEALVPDTLPHAWHWMAIKSGVAQ